MNSTQTKFNLFILGITIILMFLIACSKSKTENNINNSVNTNNVSKIIDEKLLFHSDCIYGGGKTIYYYKQTIEIDGIKHEYITAFTDYRYGITHYPECKFCKQKEGVIKDD